MANSFPKPTNKDIYADPQLYGVLASLPVIIFFLLIGHIYGAFLELKDFLKKKLKF